MSEQTPGPENQERNDNASTNPGTSSQYAKEERQAAKEQRRAERREYRYERSVSDGLGVGVTFIFIGVVWMMAKLGYLNFSIIGAIVDLWPLVFVVIGVNIVFRRVPYIGLITWVTFLSAIVGYGIYFAPQDNWIDWHGSTDNSAVVRSVASTSDSIAMADHKEVTEAQLELNLSAGDLNMGASSSNLIDYVIPKDYVDTNFKFDGKNANLIFSEDNNMNFGKLRGKGMNYDFYLNDQVLWYIDVNVGAADSDMNFSNVPVRDLEINGGAGDFNLELGDLQDKSTVSINMAAGDVNLVVPENVGLKIVTNGLISDHNFKSSGLDKMDNSYETPDYDRAAKVIYIEINSAVSDLTLERR